MAERVDMSLDDIIKMNKKGNRPNSKATTTSKRKPQQKINTGRLRSLGARSGLTQKAASPVKGPAMLHVANLHFKVSDKDIRELFADCGHVKKAAVHYEKSGRSLGTAEVVYANRASALSAIEKYNNRPLDGRPMKITLVPSARSPVKDRIGLKSGSGIQKGQASRVSGRRTGQRGGQPVRGSGTRPGAKPGFKRGQRPPKKEVTAEQLDADLEAYTAVNMKVD